MRRIRSKAPGATVLLLWLGLAAGSLVHAVSPMRFDRLGLDEGLSQQDVKVIAQDPSGFLWLGTEDGLNRYDGYDFLHVRHERGYASSLPNSYITDIALDAQGVMWIATDGGGVVARDPLTGTFTGLQLHNAVETQGLDRVRVIRFDHTGRLWIGTREHGVAVYDPATHVLHRFHHSSEDGATLGDDAIFSLLEDRRGRIWVGTGAGVDVLDPDTGQVIPHPLTLAQLAPQTRTQVQALLEDHLGLIWIATTAGLERFEPGTHATFDYRHEAAAQHSLPTQSVTRLLEDRQGRLWVGTTEGLALLDREQNTFDSYQFNAADPSSLPDNTVVSLFEDRGGLLWVGTKAGVAKWNPRSWSFGHHPAGLDEGMKSRFINAFTQDREGRLWIATFGGGIALVSPGSQTPITNLQHEDDHPDSLSDDRVMALMTDHEGAIWAGTLGEGLNRIDPRTLRTTVYRHDPADPRSLSAPGVMSLLEDSKGRIWIGTDGGGLSRFESQSDSFRRYPGVGSRITALAEDTLGYIWAGTDGGGVTLLDPASEHTVSLRHDARDPATLSGDTVYALHVDARGTVWIGTRDGGLDRVIGSSRAPARIRFANLSDANGLPNDTVYGIESDSEGRLWLSTNHGLAAVDPVTGRIRGFHRAQGLQAEEFNLGAHYRTRSGELLFGGENGYNAFQPDHLQFNAVPPKIALTALLELNRPAQTAQRYEHLKHLSLGFRDDVVTFELAALDFAEPGANRFQYQLQGFDPGWVNAGTRRGVTYTRLAGGNYTLRVRASNADGVWNEVGWAMSLHVDPPPWKTWWAYGIYAILVLATMWGAWLIHSRRLQREARYRKHLEQEVRDRTEELAQRTRELARRNIDLEKHNSILEEVSVTDALTGLGNRRSLQQAMPRLMAAIDAQQHRVGWCENRLAVLMVDLDHFKPINDQHGHESGDQVLLQVSSILTECVRTQDKVVRWGGDEFVVVHTTNSLDGAAALAERIRVCIAKKRFQVAGSHIARISVSIGFACYPFVMEAPRLVGWDDVLNIADTALYRAKASRNAWVGWGGTRAAATLTDLVDRLESDADAAVEAGYIESRSSVPAADETVEMLLRRTSAATR